MWQLLLKILEFVEWQYNSSLHKRGPNSAPLRRYKSWNTSLESGELVQICTLWEQKLAHKAKVCNSAGSPVLICHLSCTPASMFCNFFSGVDWEALGFMGRREPSPFHPYPLPWPFHSSCWARDWRGWFAPEFSTQYFFDEDGQCVQTKSPIVCNSFLVPSCIGTNHGLLLPRVSTPGLCTQVMGQASRWGLYLKRPPSSFFPLPIFFSVT